MIQAIKDNVKRPVIQQIILTLIKWTGCIVLFIMFTWSCYYDSQEFLYPKLNITCDTSNVTFTLSVKPILEQFCYSCHSNLNAAAFGGNFKLEDYQDVKLKADDGHLYGAVDHLPGYSAMPKGGAKLDDCSIATIKKWIDSGSPNN